MSGRIVLGIDGGNSKVDIVLAREDGSLLSAVRGPTISHQAVGLDAGMERADALLRQAVADAGLAPDFPVAEVLVASLAGADYPDDVKMLARALEARGFARSTLVLNDSIGALRAGVSRPWGLVLICGHGINAAAIAPDGRVARFAAVGEIAGDWGGGGGIGMEALGAAVRGRDGRGPRTSLERSVPAHFGLARPGSVTHAMYDGRIDERRVDELTPLVFEAARDGDSVARALVERLADELVAMARVLVRRLGLRKLDLEVVLGGGVFRTDEPGFYASIERGILGVAPRARLVRLRWPPVVGSVLMGIERLRQGPADDVVAERLRTSVADWDRQVLAHRTAP